MIGVSFGRCQGWFHPSEGARAVLICQPHGFEDLCTRKSLRVLAERLAGSGMPVLRYDPPGCANGDGDESDADLVAQWRASVLQGAQWLEANAGATEIVVIGMRLGALLAALEAPGIARLKGLALLAPVTSGRQYTREMGVLAKIMQPPNAVEPAVALDPASIDVCGFRISPETQASLKSLSLAAPSPVPGASVLILHQAGANLAQVAKAYETGGSPVRVAPFPGYDDMICDPTASKVPLAALSTIVDWAVGLDRMPRAEHDPVVPSSLASDAWIESNVTFGPGGHLSGVVCEPRVRDDDATPVVFLNAGMSYHIGWSRMYVRMARALAAQGIPSLRYDAAGIGDSLADGGDVDRLPLYTNIAERNLTSAIDWMEAQGMTAPLIVGACSGAYTAFHVTCRDPRIRKAVIVNLQCFEWTAALGLEVDRWRAVRRKQIAAERKAQAPSSALGALVSRMTALGMSGVRIVGRLVKRVVRSRLRGKGRALSWFGEIAAREARLALVFSAGDPGISCLEAEAGPMGERAVALPGITLQMISDADHNLTPRLAQDDLLAIIRDVARENREAHRVNLAARAAA